jgi:TolB-like protein
MGHSLFAELKRRNVFKAGVAYLALGWVVTQVTSTVAPALNLPGWIVPVVVWIGVIGFPFVVAFSWIFEITPEGLKRESEVDRSASITHVTGRRMDYLIVGLLVVAIGFSVFDRFGPRRSGSSASSEAIVPTAVLTGPATSSPMPAAPAVSDNSIAVLPFVNMSDDKANEFFSDGISEELLNLLAKITQLHVAARTSSFSFKGQNIEIPEIARRLHVANVLEGSVRKAGDQIRITAQLIRASDGYHVWSETWDRKLDDIFKIQDEIAGKVVEELKVTLLGAAPSAHTADPKAYALYLQARQLGRQLTTEAFAKSDELYRQALAIDPRYAAAWNGLSTNFANEPIAGMLSSQDSGVRCREAAEKALAIDPNYAPAHAGLGWTAMTFDNDLAGAAKHFERALALEPTNLDILRNVASFLQNLGRMDDALALNETVARRDPVNVTALHNLGYAQRIAGRYDAAIASLRTVLSLSPGRGGTHAVLCDALLLKGDAGAALAEIEQETSEVWRIIDLPMVYHALGRETDSDAALSALIEKHENDAPYNISYIYALRGEADRAFEWLDKAITYRDPGMSDVVVEKRFNNIHSDPRWLPFLRKVGKSPEQLAKIEFKVTLPKEWQAEAMTNPASSAHQ